MCIQEQNPLIIPPKGHDASNKLILHTEPARKVICNECQAGALMLNKSLLTVPPEGIYLPVPKRVAFLFLFFTDWLHF